MIDRIFVYGTLRRGGSGHDMLAGRSRFVAAATIEATMHDHGPWPSVTLGPGLAVGELYQITGNTALVLAALDGYEGPAFRRTLTKVHLATGQVADAWVYVWSDAAGPDRPRVGGGDWLRPTTEASRS